jgi:hypothetical protein
MTEREEPRADPTDGLLAMSVGEWAREKHSLVKLYIEIARGVRGKFVGESKVGSLPSTGSQDSPRRRIVAEAPPHTRGIRVYAELECQYDLVRVLVFMDDHGRKPPGPSGSDDEGDNQQEPEELLSHPGISSTCRSVARRGEAPSPSAWNSCF